MLRRLAVIALAALLGLPGSALALDALQSTTVSGRLPSTLCSLTPGGLAINRADGTLSFCDAAGTLRTRILVDPNGALSVGSLTTPGAVTAGTLAGDGSAGVTATLPDSAVGRALTAWLSDAPTILGYGAVCNGDAANAAADTAALLKAIDKANASGATGNTVRLPVGNCRFNAITRTLNSGSSLKIIGAGAEISRATFAGDGFSFTMPAQANFASKASSPEIADFSLIQTVDGTGTALFINGQGAAGTPLAPTRIRGVTIRGAGLSYGWAKGIDFLDLSQTFIDSVQWYGNAGTRAGTAITYRASASLGPVEHRITNYGVTYADTAIAAGNYVEGIHALGGDIVAVNYGVNWQTTTGESELTFVGNHVNCYIACVNLSNVADNQIFGNFFIIHGTDTTSAAVALSQAGGSSLLGNSITGDAGTAGIMVGTQSTGQPLVIDANNFRGVGTGVLLSAAAQRVRVGGSNDFAPDVSTPVSDLGSGNNTVQLWGSGRVQMQRTDNAATGGNPRGAGSVDMQINRTGAAQVVSGPDSFAAGRQNTVGGSQSGALGNGNTVSAPNAFAVGLGNNATSGAALSSISGKNGQVSSQAQTVLSGGVHAGAGKNQTIRGELAAATTDATPTRLTADGLTATASNSLVLLDNTSAMGRMRVIAVNMANGDTASWDITGLTFKRRAGASTAVLVGTPTVTKTQADSGASSWTVTISNDNTLGGVAVTFTGAASTSIHVTGDYDIAVAG